MRLTIVFALSLSLSGCVGAIVSDDSGTRVITPIGTSQPANAETTEAG